MSDWNEAYFSVDAALLAELGERLVGKPSVALAELVKNAHDADATDVLIELSQSGAEVTDNGHGMDEAAFRAFWMRVGSTHKTRLRVSRRFHRPMTGSKGVGRLSVQFLARELELRTVSADDQEIELVAKIKWDEAIAVGVDLTSVSVRWRMEPRTSIFPADPDGNTCHGTRLILRHLRQRWGNEEIRALAQEVWTLRPPFLVAGGDADEQGNVRFDVRLSAGDDLVEAFDEQLNAILKIWYARVQGRVRREGARSVLDLVLTFHDDEQHRESIGLDDFPLKTSLRSTRVQAAGPSATGNQGRRRPRVPEPLWRGSYLRRRLPTSVLRTQGKRLVRNRAGSLASPSAVPPSSRGTAPRRWHDIPADHLAAPRGSPRRDECRSPRLSE